jgi:rod shape determining protein RodA
MNFISQLIPWSRLDKTLLLALAGLMTFGVLFIYSASYNNELFLSLSTIRQPFIKQPIFYAIGIGLAFIICLKDYNQLSRWAYVFYWLNILMLILVLIPGIGTMRNGARRWFDLGPADFQPSEMAKVTFILAMAQFLSRPRGELNDPKVLFKGICIALLPFGLILLEPDLGSSLMILPAGLAMMYIAGAPARFVRKLIVGFILIVLLALTYVFFVPANWKPIELPDHQKRRLMVYFNVDYAKQYTGTNPTKAEIRQARTMQRKDSYNVKQAMISVGSGGLTGKGWKKGIQNTYGFIPQGVANNDFIFSVIAEESGFAGSTMVIILYGAILVTGLRTANKCRDRLGRIIAIGVITMLFCHVFVNIGMNIRMVPVTGLPLPLLSAGGSSVICSLMALGLLINVRLYQKII